MRVGQGDRGRGGDDMTQREGGGREMLMAWTKMLALQSQRRGLPGLFPRANGRAG